MSKRYSLARHIDPNSNEAQRIAAGILEREARRAEKYLRATTKHHRPALAFGMRGMQEHVARKRPELDHITDFHEWLPVFFVLKGSYRITPYGYESLEQSRVLRVEYIGGSTPTAEEAEASTKGTTPKEIIARNVMERIAAGRAQQLLRGGQIKHRANWERKENRTEVFRRYLQLSGKPVSLVNKYDFTENGMRGLLAHYKQSPYAALVESGYAYSLEEAVEHSMRGKFDRKKIYPWQMKVTPNIYGLPEARIAAARWLAQELEGVKVPRDIEATDFYEHGLDGLINGEPHWGSPFKILHEAGMVNAEDFEYMHNRGARAKKPRHFSKLPPH